MRKLMPLRQAMSLLLLCLPAFLFAQSTLTLSANSPRVNDKMERKVIAVDIRHLQSDNGVYNTNYYPFGNVFCDGSSTGYDVQPYKYNGKELDLIHGLNTYDYGARQLAMALPRWDRVDPLAEETSGISPYVYCENNPVNAVDPDGRSIWTKIAKVGAKVGARVYRYGWRELGKAATYTDAVSDITDNVNTVFDSKASTKDKVVAGFSLASEVLPVSIGDVKAVGKMMKAVHGNSKASTKAQHAYDIIDKRTHEIVKTGVSGGKIRKDGEKSYRAEQQVRKWNKSEGGDIYESQITHREPAGEGARDKILQYEKDRAKRFEEELKRSGKHQIP